MRTLFPLLALTALACSSSGTWRRVETPHFLLRTDLGASDAKHAGAALETTRDALVSAAWPHYKFKDVQTEVYVLANGLDFERYFGSKTAGLFLHTSPPMFFLYGSPSRWELRRSAHRPDDSVLRHEMAHELSSEVWPRQPRWFAEGLANFLEPVFYAEDEQNVVLGGINFGALSEYRGVRTTTLEDAFAWKEGLASLAQREAAGLYGISWLFVHWLYHKHPDQLARYIDDLGRSDDLDGALRRALPNFDPAAIEIELHEYQKHGAFEDILRPLVETPIVESSLPERVLHSEEVKEVKDLLAKIGAQHRGPSHAENAPDEPTKWEGSDPTKRPIAATPRKKIDYEALPPLPQYSCGGKGGTGATAIGEPPTTPAKTRAPNPRPNEGRARPGKPSQPESDSKSSLPPEEVQRVIRSGLADLRACYEEGLKRNPSLGGRVTVRLIIDQDGHVSSVAPECTSLPDPAVVSCMAKRFGRYQFPKPATGSATVIYPVMFTPSD